MLEMNGKYNDIMGYNGIYFTKMIWVCLLPSGDAHDASTFGVLHFQTDQLWSLGSKAAD